MPSNRTRDRGASLLELLICLAIIGIMVGMLAPAVMKVRARANALACQNNLRQLALGIHQYYDAHKVLPHARTCPAPWQGGKDPQCLLCSPPNVYTGTGETWWCPYDNRPGSTVTAATGAPPQGTLSPFVENSLRVFRCPDAFDRTPNSPTRGSAFQVSYAINPDIGGKSLRDVGGRILVFEHDDLPACRGGADHFTAWPADPITRADRHAAKRHAGVAHSAYYDGSVPSGH